MLVYIGTYSQRGSKGIYALRFNPATGALTDGGWSGGDVKNPSFLALHPNRKFLYAVSEVGDGGMDGAVAGFGIEATSGRLTSLNRQTSGGTAPCFVAIDPSGRCALVANYGSGSVEALPVAPDGSLQAPSTKIQHGAGSKANPGRQEGPHAHSIHVDSSNHYAVACDLGMDKLMIYRFDPARGTLTASNPPFVATKPAAGPRQFAFHPNGRLACLVNELDSTITSFRWDDKAGTLTPIETISTLPKNASGSRNHPAEVQFHPNGKWVYASNRGHDSIAVFAIDGSSGRLRSVEYTPTGGKNPRHFAIDPSGRFLIAAHQDTDNLIVHRIDADRTGGLAPTGVTLSIPAPVCVLFVPET